MIVDPKPEHLEGVAFSATDWAIRPGDIVPVVAGVGTLPTGFYVPPEAVRTLNGKTSVFVVGDDERVRQIAVSVHETSGILRRIEGEGLVTGTRLVKDGIHYVADGDTVSVVPAFGK